MCKTFKLNNFSKFYRKTCFALEAVEPTTFDTCLFNLVVLDDVAKVSELHAPSIFSDEVG
jgi:hypothetical protein